MATAVLKSTIKSNPDVRVNLDEEITIGRNKLCKINDVRCPKDSELVSLIAIKDGALIVKAIDCKSKKERRFKNSEKFEGPGYSYVVEISDGSEPPAKRPKLSNEEMEWTYDERNQVHIGKYLGGGSSNKQIAAFDFDGTLSVPKGTAKFPKDGNDFKLWNNKLVDLVNNINEHRFVIFSNQRGVETKQTKLVHVQQRILGILKLFDAKPCLVMLAIGDNLHRKPRPGMFDLLQEQFNDGIEIDLKNSYYVGDAAGRKDKTHKDHSACDLAFAINIGLPFLTPEQFIAKKAASFDVDAQFTLPAFDPKTLRATSSKFGLELTANKTIADAAEFTQELQKLIENEKKVIVISVGMPASGKSFLYKKYLEPLKFTRISRDTLKTMEKCEKEAKGHFAQSNSGQVRLAIDNTNHDLAARKRWLAIANQFGAKIIAIWMNVEKDQCLHNNLFRRAIHYLDGEVAEKVPSVPSLVIFKQAKEMVVPTPKEGFDKVYRLNFLPNFESKSQERLYYMYLMEK